MITRIPLFARKFFVDFVETGIAAVLALTLVLPGNMDEAKAQAVVIGAALLGAFIAAARRAVPAFLVWLQEKLATGE
jgi:hypothetical protein